MTLAAVLLLSGCTTTTTVTTADDSGARSRTRAAPPAARPAAVPAYVVQSGDTLYSIAFRQRVDLRELIAWNGLAEPYTIYPGQRLRIGHAPERRGIGAYAPPPRASVAPDPPRVAAGRPDPSPISTAPAPAPTESPGVAPIARADPAPPAPVASMPAIPIAVADVIAYGGVREAVIDDAQPAASTPPGAGMPMASAAAATPVAIGTTPPAAPPPPLPLPLPQTPAEPTRELLAVRSAPTRTVGGIGWRWPNAAALVGRFAADDEARQGIRLQGAPGTQVNASADGEVVYSGNGLVGLGELVIIRHGADYLSAYGLNRKRLVAEGQKVKAGEAVAEMGSSAGMAGLLHFEVRRGGRPIDPLSVLPPR